MFIFMRSLNEYIREITTHPIVEYDYLDECILNQLNIYYNFNLLTITESMILESKGSFPGQSDIVDCILKELKNFNDTNIIKINNTIIDEIYIHFKKKKNIGFECEYVTDNNKYDDYNIVRWDNENKRYRFAEINIVNYTNNDDLEELLYHETQHLWDDYQLMIHQNIPLANKVKNSLDHKFSKLNIDDTLKQILYYVNDYEISAYISQMNGMFHDKKFDNIQDAFDDIIYPSSVYKNYKWIYYALYNDKYMNKLLDIGIKKSEITKMKKLIKVKFNKIINHAYHICGEHTTQRLNNGSILNKNHKILNNSKMENILKNT